MVVLYEGRPNVELREFSRAVGFREPTAIVYEPRRLNQSHHCPLFPVGFSRAFCDLIELIRSSKTRSYKEIDATFRSRRIGDRLRAWEKLSLVPYPCRPPISAEGPIRQSNCASRSVRSRQ